MKRVSELTAKKVSNNNIEIYDGETLLGSVSPVLDSLNRPTGEWCYTIPAYKIGKVFRGSEVVEEKKLDYTNWHAGSSWREAAEKLAHKLGYKD